MILVILAGGLFWRIRGGLLDDIIGRELPNFPIRMTWVAYVTILLAPTIWFPVVAGLAYLGVFPGYFSGKFDLLPRRNRTWRNYGLLSIRGMWTLFPAALGLLILSFFPGLESPYSPHLWLGVLAGAIMPACYRIGLHLPLIRGRISHSQWGEWLYGFAIGACLCL